MKKFLGNTAYAVIGFVLACAMLLSSNLVFASSASLVGDVNGDGSVNPLDLVVLARHLAKWKGYEELPYIGEKTEFVITETPDQYFYTASGGVKTPTDYDADTEYVGLQYLENGVPTGKVFYYSCDELGIPAEDAEDYLNYLVALTDFNEDDGSFGRAIIGNDPEIITNADVSYKSNNQKLVIDGTTYTAAENCTGASLLNELLVYECTPISVTGTVVLVTNESGDIIDDNGNVLAIFAYQSPTGVKYYYYLGEDTEEIISEAQALDMFGVYVDCEPVEYTHTQIISNAYAEHNVAESMKQNAFEMYLFDDDNDGKYDRAFYEKVYLSVYDTYEIETDDGDIVICDGMLKNVYGISDMEADSVTYTNKTAKKVGNVSVFTYNEQLNTVNVIDIVESETGIVDKINTADADSGIITITVDGEKYRLGNVDADTPDTDVMEALLVPYNESENNPPIADVPTAPFIQYINDVNAFADSLAVDDEIEFYAYNGVIIYAEAIYDHTFGFAVVEEFADYDLAKIYLDLWVGGEIKESALVTKLDGIVLKELSTYKFSMLLSKKEYFFPGTIYSYESPRNTYELNNIIVPDNYADYGLIDAKVADEVYAYDLAAYEEAMAADPTQTAVAAPTGGNIEFDDGSTRGADRANRLRTSPDTVFYFIENAECDCNTPCEKDAELEKCDSINPAMRTVSVFVGQPDDATIKFNEDTAIWVDALGHGTADYNGRASVVFVVNPVAYDGFQDLTQNPYVLTMLNRDIFEYDSAENLGLPKEYIGDYYMYNNAGLNLNDGSRTTIYSKVQLQGNRVYKVDANGVVYLKDTAAFIGELDDAGKQSGHYESSGINLHWLESKVVSAMTSNRNYVKYGITDVNGQAAIPTDAQWGKPNGTVRYYDFVWYNKANTKQIAEAQAEFAELLADVANMAIAGKISTDYEYAKALGYVNDPATARSVKAFLADLVAAGAEVAADDIEFEEIPDSITGIELVTPLVCAEYVGDYVEIEILAGYNEGCYLIDQGDRITDIIVVNQSGLKVYTGEDAIELLNSAPQVMWIGDKYDVDTVYDELFSEYLVDGSILFVVGYTNNDH